MSHLHYKLSLSTYYKFKNKFQIVFYGIETQILYSFTPEKAYPDGAVNMFPPNHASAAHRTELHYSHKLGFIYNNL